MTNRNLLCALCLMVAQDPPPATVVDRFAAGVLHYRAGRYEAARAAFAAEAEALGAGCPPQLWENLALAALRVQRTSDAEAAARQIAAAVDPEVRASGEFLLASASFQRGQRAAAAAQLPDAEPMVWESAVRGVDTALRGWCRAAELRDGWPDALRNAERAQRRLAELQRLRAEDASRRKQAAREPEPPPPSPKTVDEPPQEQVPEMATAALPPTEVARLLLRLQQKDREKHVARQAAQRTSAVAGERDW